MAVAGEPTLGTPHAHYEELLGSGGSGTGFGSTAIQTKTLTTSLPVNATWVEGYWWYYSATLNSQVYISASSSVNVCSFLIIPAAGTYSAGYWSAPVTGRKMYYYKNTASTGDLLYIKMTRYWA